MKLKPLFSLLLILTGLWATAQQSPTQTDLSCEQQLAQKMDFMLDGSLTNQRILVDEVSKLASCGLDDFDVNFFGNMDVFSAMAARMIKSKKVEELTFNDLYTEIQKFKKADVYKEIRQVTLTSEALGKRVGKINNWSEDRILFEDLGASRDVIEKVAAYLMEHPENGKTYKEILEVVKG